MLDRHGLILVAEAIYRDRWHHALARALGPHHPRGARETIDPRLVGRWASGERPIPAWVEPVLKMLVKEHIAVMEGYLRSVGLLEE